MRLLTCNAVNIITLEIKFVGTNFDLIIDTDVSLKKISDNLKKYRLSDATRMDETIWEF